MADMLGTGLSSLRALQRALDTTAHNIANVSTEGYTRQRVEFETRTRRPTDQLGRQRVQRDTGAAHL
jgi:flagellar hook-associated protein 1 FlgK